jgi:hypothetical protein
MSLGNLRKMRDEPDVLWDAGDSSARGEHNRMSAADASGARESLYLILVDDLAIEILNYYGRRRIDGTFSYRGIGYRFSLTDPVFELRYVDKAEGSYSVGAALLTVSLAEVYAQDGFCYKLIAGVMPLEH